MGHALILSVYCVVSVLGKLKELLQCVRNNPNTAKLKKKGEDFTKINLSCFFKHL